MGKSAERLSCSIVQTIPSALEAYDQNVTQRWTPLPWWKGDINLHLAPPRHHCTIYRRNASWHWLSIWLIPRRSSFRYWWGPLALIILLAHNFRDSVSFRYYAVRFPILQSSSSVCDSAWSRGALQSGYLVECIMQYLVDYQRRTERPWCLLVHRRMKQPTILNLAFLLRYILFQLDSNPVRRS